MAVVPVRSGSGRPAHGSRRAHRPPPPVTLTGTERDFGNTTLRARLLRGLEQVPRAQRGLQAPGSLRTPPALPCAVRHRAHGHSPELPF